MGNHEKPSDPEELSRLVKRQRERIKELERQLDYFKKRFVAAKQAVKWFETKLRWKLEDSYGT